MTDTPAATPASTIANTATGAVTGDNLAQIIAQAVAGAVTTSLNEITAKINQLTDSVSEALKKLSVNDDNNFETTVVGAHDPYDDLRRNGVSRDRVQAYAEQALANAIKHSDALAMRSLDHFGSLPPVAAKPTGC
ncbi:MAG TPA: hypothetical protein VMF86_02810 [Stellaceae bacterium]|nr:hypothetical protein [Stellaceae bacterium]